MVGSNIEEISRIFFGVHGVPRKDAISVLQIGDLRFPISLVALNA